MSTFEVDDNEPSTSLDHEVAKNTIPLSIEDPTPKGIPNLVNKNHML